MLSRTDRAAPVLAAALVAACAAAAPAPPVHSIVLRDVTRQSGITFVHTDGSSGRRYIVETVSAGLALFDYDRDGDIDIFFLNGAPLPGSPAGPPPRDALYRNDGGFRFTDVTERAGVGDTGYGLGVAAGDYDNDGDQDLYVNNFGPNVLYRNNGDGTFTDVTRQAGVGNGDRVGAGANFLDFDGDGDLDLFVGNYLKFSFDKHVAASSKGLPVYANPRFYPAETNTLYRNNGDGTFADVTNESGIGAHASWAMGTVCGDLDNDGDTDIYVANDVAYNFLFENDGRGRFAEVGLSSGTAFDIHGDEQGSMGVDCGDYNNDGLLDLHVTSFQSQLALLYQNLGNLTFEDVTLKTGAGAGTLPHVTWGTGLVDFDNDGDRDLYIVCGHLQDNVELFDDTTAYNARDILLMNDGGGSFVPISDSAGDGLLVALSGRGAAFDDLDNDGDIDAVVLNSRREPTILRNDSAAGNHWLQVELRGTRTNRDAIGAQVRVAAGDLSLLDEVHSGRSYQSHYGTRLHFGLGKRDRVDRIEVRWIGGGRDAVENVRADRLVRIVEGAGIAP